MATIDYNKLKGTNKSQEAIAGLEAMGSGATVENAPVTPEQVTPEVNVPPVAPTIAPETPETAPQEPQIINKGELIGNVQSTIDKYGGDAGANKAFIEGAYKAAGRVATPEDIAQGGTLSEVIERVGLGGELQGFGMKQPDTEALTGEVMKQEEPKTAQERIIDLLGGYGDTKQELIQSEQERLDVAGKSQAIADTEKLVADAQTVLTNLNVFQITEAQNFIDQFNKQKSGTGATMASINAEINNKLQDLNTDQKLEAIFAQNNLNNALVTSQIAQGNYDRAQEMVQASADTLYENFQFQLQALEVQGTIEATEAKALEAQATLERDLALDGYSHIASLEQYQDMIINKGFTESDFYTDPITQKKYLKPDQDLTIAQSTALGVPFGTTWREAKKMNINIPTGGSGGSGTGGGGGETIPGDTTEFDYAREIINSNPDASAEALKTGLLEQVNLGNIDLSVTEINSLVAERKAEIKAEEDKIQAQKDASANTPMLQADIEMKFTTDEIYEALNNSGYASFWSSRAKEATKFYDDLRTSGVTLSMITQAKAQNYTNTEILETIMKKTLSK